jgi:hypothetical protein
MSFTLQGGTSGNKAEVNTSGEQLVALPTPASPERVGAVRNMQENDAGSATGTPKLKSAETSRDYRLRVGLDTMLHYDEFNSTTQNTAVTRHAFVGMTATLGGGSLLFNANSNLAASQGVQHSTWRVFPIIDTAPLYPNHTITFTSTPLANQVVEWGMFPHSTGTAAPADGIFWRYTSAGLIGVQTFNGVETQTGVLVASITANDTRKFVIVPGEKAVEWWMDDILLAEQPVPAGQNKPCLSGALPLSMQFRNAGTVTGAPVMQAKLWDWSVALADVATNKPWAGQMSGMGLSVYQGQNGGTMGQTAQWANTALPTAAAGTNTTTALGTGLGGIFQLNAPATSATDVIISSYSNPVGGVNQTPRTLMIHGCWIDAVNVGAAVATTPSTFAMALAFGHTAVSLVTTDSSSLATATTKGPRRVPLGVISFPVGAAIGAQCNRGIYVKFDAPIAVNPGEIVAVVAKILAGTATASQVIQFVIGFDGPQE